MVMTRFRHGQSFIIVTGGKTTPTARSCRRRSRGDVCWSDLTVGGAGDDGDHVCG